MIATPHNATSIAPHARPLICSPSVTRASSAAAMGDAAWRKSTFATLVWLSATMNEPEAMPVETANARPAGPDRAEGSPRVAAHRDGDEGSQGDRGEDGATRQLRQGREGELTLQHSRGRPCDRCQGDVDLATAPLTCVRGGQCRVYAACAPINSL